MLCVGVDHACAHVLCVGVHVLCGGVHVLCGGVLGWVWVGKYVVLLWLCCVCMCGVS